MIDLIAYLIALGILCAGLGLFALIASKWYNFLCEHTSIYSESALMLFAGALAFITIAGIIGIIGLVFVVRW